jgi:pimeloyl-ACP methyl ester carboxylesterase
VGGPTIILEAGSGDDSRTWLKVQERLANFANVCSYDRAGLGWSDAVSYSRSFEDRAADLHKLLGTASVKGPYVLVGHSYGGYIVRLFARHHPECVVGIVLVDASEEGYAFSVVGLRGAEAYRAKNLRLGLAARFGLLQALSTTFPNLLKQLDPVFRREAYQQPKSLSLRSSRYFEIVDEMEAYRKVPSSMRVPGGFGALENLPLVILSRSVTSGGVSAEWQKGQSRLSALSLRSEHIETQNGGHLIHEQDPETVVEAIRSLLREIS